jgi:hypothetical protein
MSDIFDFSPNCIQYIISDNLDHTLIQYSNGILVISKDFKTGKYYDGIRLDHDFDGDLNLPGVDQDHVSLSTLRQQLFIPYIGWIEDSNGRHHYITTFDWIPGHTCSPHGHYGFIE